MLQLYWGVTTLGQLSPLHLVNDYVAHRQIDQVSSLPLLLHIHAQRDAIDFHTDLSIKYNALCSTMISVYFEGAVCFKHVELEC